MIEVSGGEPTLHPDVLDICRKARQSFGGRILMFSNAWRLADQKFAQDLVATGIDEIVIALHSHNAEVHDRITQVKGSHERTLAALRNLADLSIDVSIKFITTKENVDDAPEWAKLVSREFPSARVMFNGLALWGQALDFAEELAVKHSYAAPYISAAVDIFADKGQPVGIYFMPACVFDPYYWQYFGFRHYQESILEARQGGGHQGSASYQACYELPKGCSDCVMNARCVWAWKPYERRYGLPELSPIVATCPEPS